MKANQKIILYMNDGVPCGESKSIVEAYKLLQECKAQDKEYGCKGIEYYFELETETEKYVETQEVKIYRRGNKVFMKAC